MNVYVMEMVLKMVAFSSFKSRISYFLCMLFMSKSLVGFIFTVCLIIYSTHLKGIMLI